MILFVAKAFAGASWNGGTWTGEEWGGLTKIAGELERGRPTLVKWHTYITNAGWGSPSRGVDWNCVEMIWR